MCGNVSEYYLMKVILNWNESRSEFKAEIQDEFPVSFVNNYQTKNKFHS
jgi:hypothetical protein